MQPFGWARDTLLVAHDRLDADTEGFEDFWMYRAGARVTALAHLPVAISPDGTRLLLRGSGDRVLELYDIASSSVVGSLSIADYERALVPAEQLRGADLTRWPGFEEGALWPLSCCAHTIGAPLWRDDLVLLETDHQYPVNAGDAPVRFEFTPAILRIEGNRIVPVRTVRTGRDDFTHDARWVPGTQDAIAIHSWNTGTFRCSLDADRATCPRADDLAPLFRAPTIAYGPFHAVQTATPTTATTPPMTAPATAVSPTTAPARCTWTAEFASHDGAGGTTANVFVFTNRAPNSCATPHVASVSATNATGAQAPMDGGSIFPVLPPPATVAPGGQLQVIVDSNGACDELNFEHKSLLVDTMTFGLDDGSVVTTKLGDPIEAICGLDFGEIGARP
jgi:hypothetical protein